jgi:AcrR family transcriptional regulator
MRADTTARLLAVARRAFAEQGFANTSLDALAAEAGLTRGAVHHHFGNKTGLFEAVLRMLDAEIDAILEAEWRQEPDHWKAFRQYYSRYLDEAIQPSRRRIMFQDAYAVLGSKAYEIMVEEGLDMLIADLRDLMAAGLIVRLDPEALAQMLNGAISNLAFWAADAPEGEDRLPRAHQTLDALLDGLAQG